MTAHTDTLSALGSAALHYASRRLFIHPLHNPTPDGCSCGGTGCDLDPVTGLYKGKHPRLKDWEQAATNDPDTIRGWWTKWPNANIGLACGPSGLVVIDLDGEQGIASWAALSERLGLTVATRTAITGGGGRHMYFQAPAGVSIRNSAGKLGKGIDVRGEGGYIVLPPSVHPNGNRYVWINE